MCLLLPSNNIDPVNQILTSANDLFEHVLQNVSDSDMVRMTIHNQVNQSDRPIGISFRRNDQISGDVIWSVFENVFQPSSRFNALDNLFVNVNSVKMPIGFGGGGIKRMGRPVSVLAHLKKVSYKLRPPRIA